MGDPRDIWIHVTNIVLGIAVLTFLVAVLLAVILEVTARARRRFELRAELNHDMRDLAHLFGHR